LWSCDLPNLRLTVRENLCRTALNVMLRAEAKAQVQLPPRLLSASISTRVFQETFKFIGRGSSEANLKPDQLVVLQQFKRAEEVRHAPAFVFRFVFNF
jgi:hypothetical protein